MSRPTDSMSPKCRILVFPAAGLERQSSSSGESFFAASEHSRTAIAKFQHRRSPINVVLCGTFRRNAEGLTHACEQLTELGCRILELRHLEAIQQAHFVWLHTPNGYVGNITALEIGFARASGVPVFSCERPKDVVFQKFVRVVASPRQVILNFLYTR